MRLIDADALKAEFTGNFGRELWHYTGIWATIDVAPTIDAVPVVRCKDCKHWNDDAMACDTLPWVDSSEHANWYADDFCSYGERKENTDD